MNEPGDTTKPEEEEKEKVSPSLLDAALALVKAAVKGNGLAPEKVTFDTFEGHVLHLETFERFKIEPRISEKLVHGKEKGEVVGSQQIAREKAQALVARVTLNPDVKKNTVEILKKRADLGFGLDSFYINLDTMNKVFVVHEICPVCSGASKMLCQTCQGSGKKVCIKCHGKLEIVCPVCRGMKFMNTTAGRTQCTRCYGKGEAPCKMCQRRGFTQCPQCKGGGRAQCRNCTGTGWHSHITRVEIRAKSRFDFDRESMPPEMPELLEKLRGEVVTDKHGQVSIIEDKTREEELNQSSDKDEYVIPYKLHIPWGHIRFVLDAELLEGKLFGFRPALVHTPPFLEKTAQVGLKLLAEAANTKRNAADRISEASRYRAVAETLVVTSQNGKRKALELLHRRYPFGFSAETLKRMVLQAEKAQHNVTRRTRMIGMMIGLSIVAVLDWAYYVGPGRKFLLSLAGSEALQQNLADLMLVALGGIITTLAMQISSAKALRNAIGRLVPPERRKKMLPKAGREAFIGCALGLVIYLLMVELSLGTGAESPPWHTWILSQFGVQ